MLLEGRSRNINARRRSCPTTHVLISDNSPVRKIISILTLYRMRMQGYCDVYKWTIWKRTSPEVRCLHPTSSRRKMCTLSVSNVIYHKFSHGAAFYTLNGKNVNVMLEYWMLSNFHGCSVLLEILLLGLLVGITRLNFIQSFFHLRRNFYSQSLAIMQ